uniref:site-specific DNA-methyltransferase (adenine-specific) n=1 Tax=Candidatus Kentrum sp. DK TaxID=2126562 RepID=A0A450SUX4_9GAMM|nr:MAG: adenine-specific DNA-methyltransferase [Candidatus Kentron sp. DK]
MKKKQTKGIETLTHDQAKRRNLPSAEYESLMRREEAAPPRVIYPRGGAGLEDEKIARDPDLDPQLVWRGKQEQDDTDLVVPAPPLYIQEKVHPKAIIDDLKRVTDAGRREESGQMELFADFNGLPNDAARTEFYQHDANWSNRMILGDSLQVMCSLAEREGLRGKVQCIYLDPPYGIRFNSNFQWSTTSRDVKDGKREHITREPEQVKAFRDTWRDGIHSYLSYLRDRLIVARDLLTESGSVFVQIGDENVHRVRMVMDEVFGEGNFVSILSLQKTAARSSQFIQNVADYVVWYAKDALNVKFRRLFSDRPLDEKLFGQYPLVYREDGSFENAKNHPTALTHEDLARAVILTSSHEYSRGKEVISFQEKTFGPGSRYWSTSPEGIYRLGKANRLVPGSYSISYLRRLSDYPYLELNNTWTDVATGGGSDRFYVVQTVPKVIQRCLLMATDPGDLVLDPTCGSGTTAFVAEQWGRRWITCDTSRVALALARARIMGARYPYYLLADSRAGQIKKAEQEHIAPASHATGGDVRQGFVYERVPHITLKAIANNTEIDTIWETWQPTVLATLEALNIALRGHKPPFPVTSGGRAGQKIQFDAPEGETVKLPSGEEIPAHELLEWEVPREMPADWPKAAKRSFDNFWGARMDRQREMDKSIAARADFESLYDKPFEDKGVARVAGPFTVESLSPHRVMGERVEGRKPTPSGPADDTGSDNLDGVAEPDAAYLANQNTQSTQIITDGREWDFVHMVMENLKTAGVQQAHKDDKINFTSITGWPGDLICAEGRYEEKGEGGSEKFEGRSEEGSEDSNFTLRTSHFKRAGIFIGPEFGTASRVDLVAASREALDSGFDVLIACAFNFDAHSAEFNKLGPVPILKARMNADLHMAGDLKNTGQGNLFVVFGEPDITVIEAGNGDNNDQIRIKVNGVDVFHPRTGEVRADGPDGIACWFVDTDYNEESFFVRQAYFLGANDPYKALKTTLKAEIDEAAWASLYGDTSRAFPRPKSGRVAVKVINHLGDEVMKVIKV